MWAARFSACRTPKNAASAASRPTAARPPPACASATRLTVSRSTCVATDRKTARWDRCVARRMALLEAPVARVVKAPGSPASLARPPVHPACARRVTPRKTAPVSTHARSARSCRASAPAPIPTRSTNHARASDQPHRVLDALSAPRQMRRAAGPSPPTARRPGSLFSPRTLERLRACPVCGCAAG